VQINTPDLDPSRGLATLSGELVDVSELVGSGCEVAANEQSSQFVVTGRGGVPPNPNETLRSNRVLVDFGTPSVSQESALTSNSSYPTVRSTTDIRHPSSFSNPATPLVEATGWVMDSKGEVILTDKAPTVTSHSSWLRTSSCEGR
jgi:large exoprotein involved in heme utilization and adhesion